MTSKQKESYLKFRKALNKISQQYYTPAKIIGGGCGVIDHRFIISLFLSNDTTQFFIINLN
jgi:hypothetical protein